MSGLLSGNSAKRSMFENGYMERMGKDFYKVTIDTANEHCVGPEELFTQKGERPFWHALTVAINEEFEFEGARMDLEDLTQAEVKHLIRKNFSRVLRYCDWIPVKGKEHLS